MRSISSWRDAALLLGGEHERAVFDEAAVVQEVVEVLAGGAAVLRVALGDGLGTAVVLTDLVAFVDLFEVGSVLRRFGVLNGGVRGSGVRQVE